jgi:hypothetical protein
MRATNSADATALQRTGVSLRTYLQEFVIFESIFDNTVSGHITLLENVGLLEHLPIVGVEWLWLGFSVTDEHGEEQEFSRAFRVVRVRDVAYPRHGFRQYTLDLVTHEFVTSISSRICRNFENVRVSDAVRHVMQQDLKIPARALQNVEDTHGTISVTIPNYTPLQAINYFTMLAQTVKVPHESNFLFFETLQGYHFKSIQSLILESRSQDLPLFKFDPGAVTGGPVEDEQARFSLIRMHQDHTFDLLTDITGGLLRSKMVHFDFLARKVAHVEDSRYTESFAKTTHLAPHPVYPQNYDLDVSKNTRIFTFPSNVWSSNSTYLRSIEPQPQQNMWEAIVLRNRQLREIQHLQTLIDTPGHPELRAGKVINVQYLSSHPLQGEDKSASEAVRGEPTPYFSGPHLITGLKHQLTLRPGGHLEYRMHMRVCRDSLGAPLIGVRAQEGR